MERIKTLPGPKSAKILDKLHKLTAGPGHPYPFVHSGIGDGCYFTDIDGNTFLDFASQIASNPLGYNNPELKAVVNLCSQSHPIKYAGADFVVKDSVDMLEELLSITPRNLNTAFLVNSGAEAVENCLKIAMRKQGSPIFGIAFEKAFHGRTLGALSCTKSHPIQKKSFLKIPVKHIPFDESALENIQKIISKFDAKDVGFVIVEPIQGEGGYRIASKKLMKDLRKITKQHNIPFICDEVQSGMGRTGKWWAHEHSGVKADIMSAAKALQVGAAITNKSWVPEPGSIGSTWGGGQLLDMALGIKTIQIIKKRRLLNNINKMGKYLMKRLEELPHIKNIRGRGLMIAFDLDSNDHKNNFIIECLRRGLVLLGAGESSIRVIPPYIVTEKEADEAIEIMKAAASETAKKNFKHTGKICNYLKCGEVHV